jgi:hypothetical protein
MTQDSGRNRRALKDASIVAREAKMITSRRRSARAAPICIRVRLGALCCSCAQAEPATTTANEVGKNPQHDGRHDFDFEVGRWKAHVKTLVHRLSRSTDWDEFRGTVVTRTLPMLEGWNESEMQVDSPQSGKHIELLAVRMYNPSTHQWAI